MTVTIIKKQTRPSVDIPFFFESNLVRKEYGAYFKTNYLDTGKLMKVHRTMSEDKLTIELTTEWASQVAFAEYFSDPYCIENFLKISTEYEHINGITSKSTSDVGFIRPTWKHIDAEEYFKDVPIPDNWDTLEDFVNWYVGQRMPLMIPWDAEVIRSDDAVAICIFRSGHYQVEFYLEYPNMYIRPHAHPRMEVITMDLGGGKLGPRDQTGLSKLWGQAFSKLPAGKFHGGDATTCVTTGFATLAFQRWDNPEEMTSAAVQWKGELQGPLQEALIKRKKPNAEVVPGYADVTEDTSVCKD